VNGEHTEQIVPERGLRQGDPLSPYLFLICAEAFSCLLNAAEARGELTGVKICRGAPSINHLLFADDSLLLFQINDQSAGHLQNVLSLYENCSGQLVNKDKSSVMFSKNTSEEIKSAFMLSLDLAAETLNEKYLGLPVFIGNSKVKTFSYLKDRVWKRIRGWKEKLLSKAGKEVLIKAVAQAIPSYAMSCFDITKTLCDQIGAMTCRYWWSVQDKENKMHWLSWEQLCKRKQKGGLGYRDLHLFNLAMLARQGWRLIMEPNLLCAQVLRAKYFQNGDPLTASEKPGISYTWRSILRGLQALKKGLIWRVGDGSSINIWSDAWIPNGVLRRPVTPRGRIVYNKVSDLIDPHSGTWDEELIKEIFWEEDVKHILSIPIKHGREDTLAWHFDNKGIFSVKSAYHVLEDAKERDQIRQTGSSSSSVEREQDVRWHQLWKIACPPKVKLFLWRLGHNSLPLRMNILRRGMEIDTRCPVCWRLDEDGGHCFLKCKMVKKLWRHMNLEHIRIQLLSLNSVVEVLMCVLALNDSQKFPVIGLLWAWWNARNKCNVGEQMKKIDLVSFSAHEIIASCGKKQTRPRREAIPGRKCWQPPPGDFLKVNSDGAFRAVEKDGAWGFIIRDSDGQAVVAGSGRLSAVPDAISAEGEACLAALEAAMNRGISRVIIETDSTNLVSALRGNAYDQAPGGVIFSEARGVLEMHFDDVIFYAIPRTCNQAAHELARFGLSRDPDLPSVWEDPLPGFVTTLVDRDRADPGFA